MADLRFFTPLGPFPLGELAARAGAEIGRGDPRRLMADVASLTEAGPDHLTFFDDRKSTGGAELTAAGACLIRSAMAERLPAATAALLVDDPYRGFALAAQAFHPSPPAVVPGHHPTALIDPTARIGEDCRIEAGVVVGARAEIGAGSSIGAGTVIGAGVMIGRQCAIGPGVTISCALIGERVVVHPGARIGQDGFGFAPGARGHIKIPQLGRVMIGDDVEIGANTTVDRGTLGDTVIGAGTKIDNLVQIGHNVRIGKACFIAGQVGLSGSTIVGDGVMMGGQAGSAGHLRIGDGARIAAQSGLMRDVGPGESVFGSPAVPGRQFMRQFVTLARLANKNKDR